MACEISGSATPLERGIPRAPRLPAPRAEGPHDSAQKGFCSTFRSTWNLARAWANDFDREPPSAKEFLKAAKTRLAELGAFPYPEAAGRGTMIIKGKSREISFKTIPDDIITELTYGKAAEMGWNESETADYCRALRGLRGLLMAEFTHKSYSRLLEGAKELFPELEDRFPPCSIKNWERRGEHIRKVFEVMLYGLQQQAESEEQFSRASDMFCMMLRKQSNLFSLYGLAPDGGL